MASIIKVDNLSKQYRLGEVGTGTLSNDLKRWWYRIRGMDDPFLKIGDINIRNSKGKSNYVWALQDINFEIMQGDVVGIIGKNGAGKSTLLKILSKVTGPTTGSIHYNGRIGSLLEVGTGFHPELTGRENIFLNGAILGMTKAEIRRKLDEIVDFSGVERYIDTPVKRYSSGMTVRLGFAVAAHLEPEILVVDEVLAVGDAEFQKKAVGKMQDVSKNDGRTVLFVSHNMASIQNLCKNGILLLDGKINKTGSIDEVVNHYSNANLNSVGDCAVINDMAPHRILATTKEIEFLHLARTSPYLMDTNDDISFEIVIRNNAKIDKFQLFAIIDDVASGGNRVGLSFSQELFFPTGKVEATVHYTVHNHNLAKGKYIVDFWVGTGDIQSSVKYFDAIYDTVTFQVETINGKFINEWHSYWGSSCFGNVSTKII